MAVSIVNPFILGGGGGGGGGTVVSTDFGASFPANATETQIETDLVAQADFCTGTHNGTLDNTSIDAAITIGAIFGDKTSSFPKIAWRVACDSSTAYEIDIDLVVEGGWSGSPNCRLRIGTAKSDGTHHNVSYASNAAQLHAVRNISFTTGAAQTEVWVTIDNNVATGGTAGGDPMCSFFEMRTA